MPLPLSALDREFFMHCMACLPRNATDASTPTVNVASVVKDNAAFVHALCLGSCKDVLVLVMTCSRRLHQRKSEPSSSSPNLRCDS